MICIDGVVGAGKSSLMRILEEVGFKTYPEPVIENPLLEKFYKDRKRFAFASQVFFLNNRWKQIKEIEGQHRIVLDRSIYGDSIFAKMLMQSGDMTQEEYNVYLDLLNTMLLFSNPPTLMVYLLLSVDEEIRRIQKRGRSFELMVERSYWERLNANYEEFFKTYKDSRLLIINVDRLDFVNCLSDRNKIVNLIVKEYEKAKKYV